MWFRRYKKRFVIAIVLVVAGTVLLSHVLPFSGHHEFPVDRKLHRKFQWEDIEHSRDSSSKAPIPHLTPMKASAILAMKKHSPINKTELFEFFKVTPGQEDALLNLHRFHFELDSNVCDENPAPFALIFIHSAVDNVKRRNRVRETFGRVKQVKGKRIALVFILGEIDTSTKGCGVISLGPQPSSNRSTVNVASECFQAKQAMLQQESQKFKDIVQGNFKDSYRNLTYKHVMAVGWVRSRCAHVPYVLKLDDDVLLDPYTLVEFLASTTRLPTGWSDALYCSVYRRQGPVRRRQDKWYMPVSVYPFSTFPDYCEGYAYLSTPGVLSKLYEASRHVAYFWVDDVFVTGMLATRAGVRRTDMQRGFASEMMVRASSDHVGSQLFFLAKYNLNEVHWDAVWEAVVRKWQPKLEAVPPV